MKSLKQIIFDNMVQVMEEAIRRERVTSKADFCRAIGLHKQNWRQVEDGRQSFTHAQIMAAVALVGWDVGFVFGTVDKKGNKLARKRLKVAAH